MREFIIGGVILLVLLGQAIYFFSKANQAPAKAIKPSLTSPISHTSQTTVSQTTVPIFHRKAPKIVSHSQRRKLKISKEAALPQSTETQAYQIKPTVFLALDDLAKNNESTNNKPWLSWTLSNGKPNAVDVDKKPASRLLLQCVSVDSHKVYATQEGECQYEQTKSPLLLNASPHQF